MPANLQFHQLVTESQYFELLFNHSNGTACFAPPPRDKLTYCLTFRRLVRFEQRNRYDHV
jgi:hypothetical protein